MAIQLGKKIKVLFSSFKRPDEHITFIEYKSLKEIYDEVSKYTNALGGSLSFMILANGKYAILHQYSHKLVVRGWVDGVSSNQMALLFTQFNDVIPPDIEFSLMVAQPLSISKYNGSNVINDIRSKYREVINKDDSTNNILGKTINVDVYKGIYDDFILSLTEIISLDITYDRNMIYEVRSFTIQSITEDRVCVDLIVHAGWVNQRDVKFSQSITLSIYAGEKGLDQSINPLA